MDENNLEFEQDQELEEEEIEIMVLVAETGRECEFEIVDELEEDGNRYLALLSMEDCEDDGPDSDELLLVKAVVEDGGETMVMLEDDNEFEKISKLFTKRLEEFFDIVDESGEEEGCSSGDCHGCENCE